MGGPPHPQTDQDREYLRSLFPYFKGLPEDFQFPLAIEQDPPYVPPNNTFYCWVTAVVLCGITTVIVVLRFWVRRHGFGMDDWVMLASFVGLQSNNARHMRIAANVLAPGVDVSTSSSTVVLMLLIPIVSTGPRTTDMGQDITNTLQL
ncbi:hypothetical protein TWF281_011253 [Arthrobotrys megalospora]